MIKKCAVYSTLLLHLHIEIRGYVNEDNMCVGVFYFYFAFAETWDFLRVYFSQQTLHAYWNENGLANNDLLKICKTL